MELAQALIPAVNTLRTLFVRPLLSNPSSFRPLLSLAAPALVSLTREPPPAHVLVQKSPLVWFPSSYQVRTHQLSVSMCLTCTGTEKGPAISQSPVLSGSHPQPWFNWKTKGKTHLFSDPQSPSSQVGKPGQLSSNSKTW